MKREQFFTIITLSAFLCFSIPGCVKIETGQTAEEAAESSELRAKQIRGRWSSQINQASPKDCAYMLGEQYKKVTSVIYNYGTQTAQRWDEGQQGRGKEIDDVEMRKMVDLWLSGEKPILKAYEDNLEYAYQQLELSDYFNNDFLNEVRSLLDSYYDFYSKILFPQGSLNDYSYTIETSKNESDKILNEFYDKLDRIY